MTISIRLDAETETALRQQTNQQHVQLSEFVRLAIQEKLARSQTEPPSPYELGQSVFGRYGSGESDRSVRRKQIMRSAMNAKHRR